MPLVHINGVDSVEIFLFIPVSFHLKLLIQILYFPTAYANNHLFKISMFFSLLFVTAFLGIFYLFYVPMFLLACVLAGRRLEPEASPGLDEFKLQSDQSR